MRVGFHIVSFDWPFRFYAQRCGVFHALLGASQHSTCGRRAQRLDAQDEQVLAAAGFDVGRHMEVGTQPGDAVDQPPRRLLPIGEGWAASHDLATALALKAFNAGHDWGRIEHEEAVRPWNYGRNRTLPSVTGPVGETFLGRPGPTGFALGLGGTAVDARSPCIVDRHRRVDRFVTQPATPRIVCAHLVESAH